MPRRPQLLPILAIAAAAWTCLWLSASGDWKRTSGFACGPSSSTSSEAIRTTARRTHRSGASGAGQSRGKRLARDCALSGDSESDDLDTSSFAGFAVGLLLLPHVFNCLTLAFNVFVGPGGFEAGPYGITAISTLVTFGVVSWSVMSLVQRGEGLPSGPLGLITLAEALSYVAVVGMSLALSAVVIRTPEPPPAPVEESWSIPMPSMPDLTMPQLSMPELPSVAVPNFKPPELKLPSIRMPELKPPRLKEGEEAVVVVKKVKRRPGDPPEKTGPVVPVKESLEDD